jgi:hypothetical protein
MISTILDTIISAILFGTADAPTADVGGVPPPTQKPS